MRASLLPLLVMASVACGPVDDKPYLTRFDRPLHICHQGGEDIYPTNTMYAYQHCVDDWATDVLEIDIHQTADGHLVVLHDETLDRTTNGEGLVKEMTLEEIQAFDAAYDFLPENGAPEDMDPENPPLRGQGIVIPTLREVFEAFPNYLTNIEIKQIDPPIEEALVDMIVEFDMVESTCLGSFNDDVAGKLAELLPEACHYAPEGLARNYFISSRASATRLVPAYVDAFALPRFSGDLEVIDQRLVDSIHGDGKHLWAWTIDDVKEMSHLLDLGLDGIMTNRPDRLDGVMLARGLR